MAVSQLQSQVQDLVDFLPLDSLRIEDDLDLLEDEDGVLYAVEADAFSFGGLEEDAEAVRIKAGKQLEVEPVDPEQLNEKSLQAISGASVNTD